MELGEGSSLSTPSKKPEKPKEDGKTHITVRCSVFFDGTLNNRINTAARIANSAKYIENKVAAKDNSYENDVTNVAKMEPYVKKAEGFKHSVKVYVEGPGTVDEGSDKTRGYAFGTGSTGVKAKVAIGLDKTTKKITKAIGRDVVIDKLVLDVFGFSRGAAGARFFVHEALNNEPYTIPVDNGRGGSTSVIEPFSLIKRLQAKGYEITQANIEFKFVGLYDTVASEGIAHWNDTHVLKLDSLSRSEVKKVIHLVAADEHRANFTLTDISSAGKKGKEIFLPGVHSDIGGSYLKSSSEGQSEQKALTINRDYSRSKLEKDRQQLIHQGWYKDKEIWIDSASFGKRYLQGPVPHVLPDKSAQHKLKVYRPDIGHDYDKIPLHIMSDFARQAGINLEPKLERDAEIPETLTTAFNTLKAHANDGNSSAAQWFNKSEPAWLPEARHKYFHFSAHYTLAAKVIAPNKPSFIKGQRARKTYEG